MSEPTTPTNGRAHKNGNAEIIKTYGPWGAIALALLSAVPGAMSYFKDAVTRQEMVEYVREHAPYIHDRKYLDKRLDRLEDSGSGSATKILEMTNSVSRMDERIKTMTTEVSGLRADLREIFRKGK